MSDTADESSHHRLTRGPLLARNVLWNFLGQALPLLAAVVAVPLLIDSLGTDRFGILTLVWAMIGYFSVFDFGLGRALTQYIASQLGKSSGNRLAPTVWSALALTSSLGIAAAGVLLWSAPWLVDRALGVPSDLRDETQTSLLIIAGTLPLVTTSAGLIGILEAHQRFGLIASVRVPLGVLTFIGPLVATLVWPGLVAAVAVQAASRVIAGICLLALCLQAMPALSGCGRLGWRGLIPLMRYGGWITVSNLIGPLMVYLDRFLIAGMISATAVAYYTTPYEAVTRMWVVPVALAGVLFPALTTAFTRDRERTRLLARNGAKYIFLALFPFTLVVVAFAHEGLALWLGDEFANESTRVLQILAVGVFINSMAHTPFAVIQALGRPDITAKLHLVELPLYVVGVLWLIGSLDIEGAAIAWTIRVAIDAALLFAFASRLLGGAVILSVRGAAIGAAAVIAFGFVVTISSLTAKFVFCLLVLAAFTAIAWLVVISEGERALLRNRLSLRL